MAMESITVLPDQSEILHYENPAFPLFLIRSALSHYSDKRVLCHWHKEMEFFYVEKGRPAYFVNGNIVQLNEGDIIFINSKTLHYGFSPDGEDSIYVCLVFMPSLLSPNSFIKSSYLDPLTDEENLPYIVFSKKRSSLMKNELMTMLSLDEEKKPTSPLLLLSHLYSFWADFLSLRGQEKTLTMPSTGKTLLLKKMLAFLYSHYQEKISVENIASAALIGSSYAIHLFHDYLHSSPIVYLNAFRIEKATDLLKESEMNMSEIASNVGLDSPSYFSELFRRSKGCSPRAYQKKVQQNEM